RFSRDWSSDVCSSDLLELLLDAQVLADLRPLDHAGRDERVRRARWAAGSTRWSASAGLPRRFGSWLSARRLPTGAHAAARPGLRSEERRVGKGRGARA